jgi:Sortase domain/Bacterial Ig-like domain (group 1)
VRIAGFAAILGCALASLAVPHLARAVEPPNPNDPCSRAGRNICGTLGVGFHANYRYGIRWFGDFRGVVPDAAHTFCLDLGYWYPSPAYRFREAEGPLRNRLNEPVSLPNRQMMAFAIWTHGRSSNANQQAALMLYVHSLMGDARPGEVDPAALGPAVASIYERVARESARLHGPYRLEVRMPGGLTVGRETTATIRLLAASGDGVPNVAVTLSARGAGGLPERLETNAEGQARVTFTPSLAGEVRLTARTAALASTLPRVFSPTTAAAARNGQRLVVPASQSVTDEATATVTRARLSVSSEATPNRVLVGEPVQDRVTIGGALESWRGDVAVRIYGPFAAEDAIRCEGQPASTGSLSARGSGTFTTPAARLNAVGWYTYVLAVPGDASHVGVTTPCRAPNESFRVETQPRVQTVVSEARVQPGTAIHDRVTVSGLAGQRVTVQAALYGPFGAQSTIACAGTPAWTGSLDVTADGEYRTADFTVTVPGYYTYVERIAGEGFVRAAETRCGEVPETTVVTGSPRITTAVSDQETRPGASITDRVVVTGLGRLTATVQVRLWGPFPTRGAIRCSGTPHSTATFTAEGDGTYTTAPVAIERAGYYTYQESIAETPAYPAFTTPCGEASETTFARSAPSVTTLVSSQVVLPGTPIFDRIRVRGLGRTEATIEVELFGPFGARDAIRCTGTPFWQGRVLARGDGELRSPSVRVERAGFYTYRERLRGSDLVAEHETECALTEETTLSRPQIVTGRGDVARHARAGQEGGASPTRVRLASLGIDAPVAPVAIDTRNGVLGVPPPIARTGWWRDGMAPGARSGAILIAGHVDSARAGPGAFFRLREANAGDRVEVQTANGRTHAYRVVSVRRYLKSRLPADVYSSDGPRRLVLVTCGGPFETATGRYRDNVVVTAVPA